MYTQMPLVKYQTQLIVDKSNGSVQILLPSSYMSTLQGFRFATTTHVLKEALRTMNHSVSLVFLRIYKSRSGNFRMVAYPSARVSDNLMACSSALTI